MSPSDKVLVGTSLFLGVAALLAPAVAEWLKRRFWAAELEIVFNLAKPDCHRTTLSLSGFTPPQRDTIIYRARVKNTGRTQAHKCEVLLTGLLRANAAGAFIRHERLTPVRLQWSAEPADFLDLNPDRDQFVDLFYVLHPEHNAAWLASGDLIEWPDTPRAGNGLKLNTKTALYSQPNWLSPGKYRLELTAYAENAKEARISLDVVWSGNWQREEAAMFNECVVSRGAA